MAELNLTKDARDRVVKLVAAVSRDAALRKRFRADPRAVLDEHGLAHLVPDNVTLEVEVGEPPTGPLPVEASAAAAPLHFDIPHVDISKWPDPLPPVHWDWAHMDSVESRGGRTSVAGVKITPVIRNKLPR